MRLRSSLGRPTASPASTARVKGEVGPWKDWRLYLPVVERMLEADRVVLRPVRAPKPIIEVEKGEKGWRVRPVNTTLPYDRRRELEKILALLLHPHKWEFTLELKINTTAPQP